MSVNMELFDKNIKAKLVYDGKTFTIPDEMKPLTKDNGVTLTDESLAQLLKEKGQLQGSDKEKLCELAGRVCYDSLGRGRNSKEYWEHIRQVAHLSVIEHAYFTVKVKIRRPQDALCFLNRRGIWVNYEEYEPQALDEVRVTFNLRALYEGGKWTRRIGGPAFIRQAADAMGNTLYASVQPECPLILPPMEVPEGRNPDKEYAWPVQLYARVVEPQDNNERVVSLFLSGSRGFSHEMVRHRMNMSQRSTRYVDEDCSPWIEHPNITAVLTELDRLHWRVDDASIAAEDTHFELTQAQWECFQYARKAYKLFANYLEKSALARGVDKQTARKQARGAARGFLGNALHTELIFTASVNDWKEMIRLRLNDAADAEIRVLFYQVLQELKKSQYGAEFASFDLIPATDGLGYAVKEDRTPACESKKGRVSKRREKCE